LTLPEELASLSLSVPVITTSSSLHSARYTHYSYRDAFLSSTLISPFLPDKLPTRVTPSSYRRHRVATPCSYPTRLLPVSCPLANPFLQYIPPHCVAPPHHSTFNPCLVNHTSYIPKVRVPVYTRRARPPAALECLNYPRNPLFRPAVMPIISTAVDLPSSVSKHRDSQDIRCCFQARTSQKTRPRNLRKAL
jgi:hypothetical protein